MNDLDSHVRQALDRERKKHTYIPEQSDCGCGCWMDEGCSCGGDWPCGARIMAHALVKVLDMHVPHECRGILWDDGDGDRCSIIHGGSCANEGRCAHCRREFPCATVESIWRSYATWGCSND